MRLYLFPITRTRTLIYCKRTKTAQLLPSSSSTTTTTSSDPNASPSKPPPPAPKPPLLDRVTARANSTWVTWESAPSGWKKKVTTWGNQLFATIPYTEWGLKSIPPLSSARKAELTTLGAIPRNSSVSSSTSGAGRRAAEVDVVYPAHLFQESQIRSVLEKLATENKGLYRKRMIWSMVAMPFTAPFALIPVVPNLPFFYLVFRAWSYWRAGNGCTHVEHLLAQDLVNAAPSRVLQQLYDVGSVDKGKVEAVQGRVAKLKEGKEKEVVPEDEEVERVVMEGLLEGEQKSEGQRTVEQQTGETGETILYPKGHGKVIGLTLNMPEVEVELERAHDQVTKALAKAKEEAKETSMASPTQHESKREQ